MALCALIACTAAMSGTSMADVPHLGGIWPVSTTAFESNQPQEAMNKAFEFAKTHGDYLMTSSVSLDPTTYWWRVDPKECSVNGVNGRCVLYTWQETRSAGYGYGGIERSIFRTAVFAIYLGPGLYQTNYQMIDFFDPYQRICSDHPSHGIAACAGTAR